MSKYKLKIEDDHLRVFAGRNPPHSDFFIYMFTNRKLINNMQSTTEVEIFKWVEKNGKCEIADLEEPKAGDCIFHDRPKEELKDPSNNQIKVKDEVKGNTKIMCADKRVIYAPTAVTKDFEKIGKKVSAQMNKDINGKEIMRTRRRGERMYINWAIRKPNNDGWTNKDGTATKFFYTDKVENEDKDKDTEFWNKFPTVYKKSSDEVGRIIFNAGSRANWIYDLQLIDGEVRIFSKHDFDTGNAFGLQKRPFVQDIDFIDHNFVSVLTKDKIFQWKHTVDIKKERAEDIDEGEETLLKVLP